MINISEEETEKILRPHEVFDNILELSEADVGVSGDRLFSYRLMTQDALLSLTDIAWR